MSKPRLTNADRDELLYRILKFKFDKLEKELQNERSVLFDETIYATHSDTSKVMELYALHPGMFNTIAQFSFSVVRRNAPTVVVTFSGRASLPFDAHDKNLLRFGTSDLDKMPGSVRPKLKDVIDRTYAMEIERTKLRQKLNAFLASVTTYKKLYELWPELNEIVPQPEDGSLNNYAMTVNVSELNAAIPLPSEKS